MLLTESKQEHPLDFEGNNLPYIEKTLKQKELSHTNKDGFSFISLNACKYAFAPNFIPEIMFAIKKTKNCRLHCLQSLHPNLMCPRLDSNQHTYWHHPLKMACLPIPPRGLSSKIQFYD